MQLPWRGVQAAPPAAAHGEASHGRRKLRLKSHTPGMHAWQACIGVAPGPQHRPRGGQPDRVFLVSFLPFPQSSSLPSPTVHAYCVHTPTTCSGTACRTPH